ncbi:MAG: SSS family solute:Na+ symporter [Limisphaerales bacterium]|jgi:SSS family solute:Na+ symporter
MNLQTLDYVAFIGFLLLVVGTSLWQSRKEKSSKDYFLAGRGLSWWVIGLSLIASNISTEHFVGMAGQGFKEGIGMAIASYEWIAALSLILVAFFLLPRFLKAGIYTMPEYLEYRYNRTIRTLMSFIMLLFYVSITMATVLLLGAKPLEIIFGLGANPIDFLGMQIHQGIWLIGLIAGAYTVYGGLKAVVWSDVIQATALIVGGIIVTILALQEVGGWNEFVLKADGRLDAVLPANHHEYPWTAIFIGGMWIPNIFYWGLNQFITQRTLGAKSIREGQKGILFGASLKLIIPLIVVIPGIVAFELYGAEIGNDPDAAYPTLIKNILPVGLTGIMLAALFGAVMSTLDSLLNSAATLFTLDFYKPFINKEASNDKLVKTGRIATVVLMLIACLWAPVITSFEGGMYKFIQQYWGYVQPGLTAAFLIGMFWKKVPPSAALAGILINPPVYGYLLYAFPQTPFLHHMGICFLLSSAVMTIITLIKPLTVFKPIPVSAEVDFDLNDPIPTSLKIWSGLIVIGVIGLYIFFS